MIAAKFVTNRYESFVLLPGEKKIEVAPDTREFGCSPFLIFGWARPISVETMTYECDGDRHPVNDFVHVQ